MNYLSYYLKKQEDWKLYMSLSSVLLCVNAISPAFSTGDDTVEMPTKPPPAIKEKFELPDFYQQWIDVRGFPIVSSETVNPYAIREAAWLIEKMIGHRPDLLQALSENKVRFSIMAYNEMTTKIPEHSDLIPDFYWDRRARGLGATSSRPSVSCGEENLLNYKGDPYGTENILIHEFAHAIHQMGLSTVDPDFDKRLMALYKAAMDKELWKSTYASTNKEEYWAEGTQSWFNTNRENDAQHNHVSKRGILKEYDPDLAELLTEIYEDADWRYTNAIERLNLPHLEGYNPDNAPKFQWPPELAATYEKLFNPKRKSDEKWVDLKRYEPNQLSTLESHDGERTAILFVNKMNTDITYYWIDAEGQESYRGRAAANAFSIHHTHAGHIWLVKNANGDKIGIFQGEEKTGRALIK